MTRLLQVMAGARHGGAEGFFTRMALALQRAGQAQRLAIRRDPARAAMLRGGGIDVTELPFGGWFDFSTRPKLRRLLADWQPDIVLSWMNRASQIVPQGRYIRVARLGGYYDLKYYRRCQHLIGNTKDIVVYLVRNGWPADRAHYLPNFVDAKPGHPVDRTSLGTPADAPLLLALGRLHKVKGFDILLHAMAQLPGVYLWIAGEGDERPALEAVITRLGLTDRVRLLGWRQDTADLMASADLLVCPSRHEPLGNVILEAWAQRLPVIASAAAGPLALIRPGETGLITPLEDADAIALSVRTVLDHPGLAQGLIAAGYESFAQSYAEPAVVAAYRDFFSKVTQ